MVEDLDAFCSAPAAVIGKSRLGNPSAAPSAVAIGGGSVWVTDSADGVV
jgi:hypothetical protein